MDLSLREVSMQEPQLDKVLRQGFVFVKADRIQNWSEQECRTVFNRMFANYGVDKYLHIKKSPEEIIELDIMH